MLRCKRAFRRAVCPGRRPGKTNTQTKLASPQRDAGVLRPPAAVLAGQGVRRKRPLDAKGSAARDLEPGCDSFEAWDRSPARSKRAGRRWIAGAKLAWRRKSIRSKARRPSFGTD